jgi:hypothetical protein
MSIDEVKRIIKDNCDSGELFGIEPLITTDRIIRHLYVTAEIYENLNKDWKDDWLAIAWRTTRQVMDSYVSGRLIQVGSGKPQYEMTHLDKPKEGVWDLRASNPPPGIRIGGQFAAKDLFIGVYWDERLRLGGFNSFFWRNLKRTTQARWRSFFNPYQPIISEDSNDYISKIILN